jgi:hypothetical protein
LGGWVGGVGGGIDRHGQSAALVDRQPHSLSTPA